MSMIDLTVGVDDLLEPILPVAKPIAKRQELTIFREFPWSETRPNCLAFCYPRRGLPFIIKGCFNEVDTYLRLNGQPIVVHYTIYSKTGKSKAIIVYGLMPDVGINIIGPTRSCPTGGISDHQRWWITVRKHHNVVLNKAVRYIPRKWLKDLDPWVSRTASPVPLNPTRSKPLVGNPVLPESFISQEERKQKKAILRSKNVMAAVLKEVGAIGGNNFFEETEAHITEMELGKSS